VNLLMCGQAVSNVFDGSVELDSGGGGGGDGGGSSTTLLRGITQRSDIGLLSLFEHHNICKVSRACGVFGPHFPPRGLASDETKYLLFHHH